MSALWIIVGLAALGAIGKLMNWSLARSRKQDLGVVSHQWIAEHRQSLTSNDR